MAVAALELRKGDAFIVRVTFKDKVTGDPYPMTDWDLEGTMRYSNCPAVDLTPTWIATEPGGIARLKLTSEETSLLHVGEYELQVRAISPDGDGISTQPVTVDVRD